LQQINDEAVLLVKIADRIDNLRTLIWVFPDKKVESKLQETIDYILPLAKKLKWKNSKPYDILLNEIEKIKKYLKNSQTNKELTDLFSKK
jgi:(p)ppGpp synthase/HD superfamily hydrolase